MKAKKVCSVQNRKDGTAEFLKVLTVPILKVYLQAVCLLTGWKAWLPAVCWMKAKKVWSAQNGKDGTAEHLKVLQQTVCFVKMMILTVQKMTLLILTEHQPEELRMPIL